jgi:hypothetical protein
LVQVSCWAEDLTLDCFAKVVLEHTASALMRSADHDVAKTNIVLLTWCTAADTNHEAKSDIREAV